MNDIISVLGEILILLWSVMSSWFVKKNRGPPGNKMTCRQIENFEKHLVKESSLECNGKEFGKFLQGFSL